MALVRAQDCVSNASASLVGEFGEMTKRQLQVATHNISNILWRILNDDGLSCSSIGRLTGYHATAIKTGINKCRERTEDDPDLMKIYEEAKEEYLCSNSPTV